MSLSDRSPIRQGCGKRRYRDELAAKLALARIAQRDQPGRPKTERRPYFHKRCGGWHLTSQPRSAPEPGNPPARRTQLNPVSDKRNAENRERRAMVNRRWPDGERPRCARPGCPRLADDLHEILTRARGGSITDEANTVPLCRQDNGELTLEPAWGYELGLLRHSWDGPPPRGEVA